MFTRTEIASSLTDSATVVARKPVSRWHGFVGHARQAELGRLPLMLLLGRSHREPPAPAPSVPNQRDRVNAIGWCREVGSKKGVWLWRP